MNNKVGKLFTRDGRDVWRLTGYMEQPCCWFENLETGEIVCGGEGSLIIQPFEELKSPKTERPEGVNNEGQEHEEHGIS